MIRIENRCCDCVTPAYPCRGTGCLLRRYEAHYCDLCGEELGIDEIYEVDDMELCENCAEEAENG